MKHPIMKTLAVFVLSNLLFIRCGSSSILGSASTHISALSVAGNLGTMAGLLQTPGLSKVLGGECSNRLFPCRPHVQYF